MKRLVFLLFLSAIIATLATSLSFAQPPQEHTALERGAYVLAASTIYVAYDYLVYAPNQWEEGSTEEIVFRATQIVLLGGLTWFLVDRFGWRTGVAFGALYFSWCLDASYYLLYGRNAWHDDVESGTVTWARHTPASWFENPTSARTLKIQMTVGVTVSILFLI